ncbi:uncharacterized protein KIAA1143 homolog [Leptidea sinapis]|uniref:DUF4604 domain-containing protein n=1 Tax=Leptidea sinapis TaxID=189913 RepID=A0A5E4PY06_9NEOP|nr:uncharacterized protein KIAA1143 homolog [Leptidea sinapis]VVC89903.1 unnamed protein product [Leptidea sinapis]
MNRKRNVNYIKPDDPPFLKVLKKQAGYEESVNHKFDKLQNDEADFVEDDESELPQVVVLKEGDLTAEEADLEKEKADKIESETKADLSQRVIFKSKRKSNTPNKIIKSNNKSNSNKDMLSFNDDDEEISD